MPPIELYINTLHILGFIFSNIAVAYIIMLFIIKFSKNIKSMYTVIFITFFLFSDYILIRLKILSFYVLILFLSHIFVLGDFIENFCF